MGTALTVPTGRHRLGTRPGEVPATWHRMREYVQRHQVPGIRALATYRVRGVPLTWAQIEAARRRHAPTALVSLRVSSRFLAALVFSVVVLLPVFLVG